MKHIKIEGLRRIKVYCLFHTCDHCKINHYCDTIEELLKKHYNIDNTAPACWTEKEINIILKAVREQQ